MSANKTQISPIPPEGYGDRFIKFISGITMPREEAETDASTRAQQEMQQLDGQTSVSRPSDMHSPVREAVEGRSNSRIARLSPDQVIDQAEYQAHRSGSTEEDTPERTMKTRRSESIERALDRGASITLPVVEEVGEGGSMGGRSANTSREREREPSERSREQQNRHNARGDGADSTGLAPQNMLSPPLGGRPPPTPPKDVPTLDTSAPMLPMPDMPTSPLQSGINRNSWFSS